MSFKTYFVLLILIVISFVLGTYNNNVTNLSNDELISLNTVTGFGILDKDSHVPQAHTPNTPVFTQDFYWDSFNLKNVVKYTAYDNGNMLSYYYLIYKTIDIFGVKISILRSVSYLFYLFTFLLLFIELKKIYSEKAAIITSLFFLTNTLVMHYAHMLRSYEFCMFFSFWSSIIIFNASKDKYFVNNRFLTLLLYTCCLLMSFLGHYYTLYIFFGHFIYIVIHKKWTVFIGYSIAMFMLLVCIVIWFNNGGEVGWAKMNQIDKTILSGTSVQTKTSIKSILDEFITLSNNLSGYCYQYLGYRVRQFFFLCMLPIGLIVFTLTNFKPTFSEYIKRDKFLQFNFIMYLSFAFFLILTSIRSGHTTSFHARYAVFMVPYWVFLFSYAVFKMFESNQLKFKLIGVIIILLQISIAGYTYKIPFEGKSFTFSDANGEPDKLRLQPIQPNPFRDIADFVVENYAKDDTLIFKNAFIAQNTNLYLNPEKPKFIQKIDTMQVADLIIKSSGDKIISYHK